MTVQQPWAYAILTLGKDIENRTWRANDRGLLLIHAGRSVDTDAAVELDVDTDWLPRAAIVGAVTLRGISRDCDSPWALPGHWQLGDPVSIDPVPCRGTLRPFTPPAHVLAAALPQLGTFAPSVRRDTQTGAPRPPWMDTWSNDRL